jgi:L-aspartate semialdehyde sulfurtransferase ferredoxin
MCDRRGPRLSPILLTKLSTSMSFQAFGRQRADFSAPFLVDAGCRCLQDRLGSKTAKRTPVNNRPSRSLTPRTLFYYAPDLLGVYTVAMAQQVTRLWLMYPSRLITRPVIYELGKKFAVVTNIRQASVTEEIGVVSIELDGERQEIKRAIAWLEEQGIKVEPVEINTIEG